MPNKKLPDLQGADAYLKAARASSSSVKQRFKNDPEGLAKLLGVSLPEKPVLKMIRLGIITEDEAIKRFGTIFPGLRDFVLSVCKLEVTSAVVVGPRGGGKEICISTPIPTPCGWTTMGKLKKGQTVFDRYGQPCTVTRLYEIHKPAKCYEIEFGDGSTIKASAEHKWITETGLERAANYMHDKREKQGLLKDWRTQWFGRRQAVRTTQEIRDTLRFGKRGDLNHSVTSTKSIKTEPKDFPIHPYVLGFWLGDGASANASVYVNANDLDVVRRFKRLGQEVGTVTKRESHCYIVGLLRLFARLRDNDLLNNKHVPPEYLRGSIGQRRWLLAGLMDSDGTCRNYNGNCQFDNMNENLSDAVYELVVSLGWKATRYKKDAWLDGVYYGVSHGVSFRPTKQVFKCKRKAAVLAPHLEVAQQQKHLHRMIVDVREIPSVPMRCIQVDSPSETFLCGEQMVPTHNSKGVSFIEFFLWMILDFEAINLGGSELQAANVYDYLIGYIEAHPDFRNLLKGETKVSESKTKTGAWIKVLAASSKSVRSPHAGGIRVVDGVPIKRGGLLVIDEEAECDPDIVETALGTINTAMPSVNCRASTFHNEFGSFASVVDNAEDMGFTTFRWDIFDVCAGCKCKGDKCESEEQCFREDHIEKVTDPDTGIIEDRLIHKAYCGGRARWAEGWVPYEEIVTFWKRIKRNHTKFEIEQMGSRPSSSGFVIKDQAAFLKNQVDEIAINYYLPGFPVSICVDWGSNHSAVTVWQALPGDRHVLLEAQLLEEAGVHQIFGVIIGYIDKYIASFEEIAADTGGGGDYLNPTLRDKGYPVRDVRFGEQKEAAVAAINIYNEGHRLIIPKEHQAFIVQGKGWRRINGAIKKGNDHLCDTMVCYFAKFIDDLGVTNMRIMPAGFTAGNHGNPMPLVPSIDPKTGTEVYRPQLSQVAAASFGARGSRRGKGHGW